MKRIPFKQVREGQRFRIGDVRFMRTSEAYVSHGRYPNPFHSTTVRAVRLDYGQMVAMEDDLLVDAEYRRVGEEQFMKTGIVFSEKDPEGVQKEKRWRYVGKTWLLESRRSPSVCWRLDCCLTDKEVSHLFAEWVRGSE